MPDHGIVNSILMMRGAKVILDADLASLYGVATKRFNEQVRRNKSRFPPDFMFRLTAEEQLGLRSHSATSNRTSGRGGRRYLPYAFTEHERSLVALDLKTQGKFKEVHAAIQALMTPPSASNRRPIGFTADISK